ncbi:MAG: winged helix-turn-helix domain-containing protein [Nanoarchaeota archaeon]|nr:ArsR family transcriptional regulator [Nanoarchaeota archaeon]MBU1030142.1 ArsR family transcriptional regulator [Nanoarchaeota archaeon]MBU1850418.1 ArsR family transcriptional regulator [Nanoarchaeota archaeon]
MRFKRITIISARRPEKEDVNEKLKWFGGSLGLFNIRDKDKSCFRIFIVLLKNVKIGKPMSSDEIAQTTGLTRGTAVHHLNRLMSAGIVTVDSDGYELKVDKLEYLVEIIKSNVDRTFENLSSTAKELDKLLGL